MNEKTPAPNKTVAPHLAGANVEQFTNTNPEIISTLVRQAIANGQQFACMRDERGEYTLTVMLPPTVTPSEGLSA